MMFRDLSVPFASIATESSFMREHTARSRHTGIWGHPRGAAPAYRAGGRASEKGAAGKRLTHHLTPSWSRRHWLVSRRPATISRELLLLAPRAYGSLPCCPASPGLLWGWPFHLRPFPGPPLASCVPLADPNSLWSPAHPGPFLPGLLRAFADPSILSFLFISFHSLALGLHRSCCCGCFFLISFILFIFLLIIILSIYYYYFLFVYFFDNPILRHMASSVPSMPYFRLSLFLFFINHSAFLSLLYNFFHFLSFHYSFLQPTGLLQSFSASLFPYSLLRKPLFLSLSLSILSRLPLPLLLNASILPFYLLPDSSPCLVYSLFSRPYVLYINDYIKQTVQ